MSQPTLPSSEKILAALREARTKIEALERRQNEPIAVVGMGCRFPGNVNTPEEFWRLLQDGVDAIREVPPDRWDVDAYYDPDPEAHGKMYTRQGGFLEQVDRFDAPFFGLSPREVVSMDPQQRLLLEVSWEAFEHANLAPTTLFDSATGVFVGICGSDYGALLTDEELAYTQHGIYALTGNALSVAAGRIAYTLGLTGPCVAIDTACSSSLVAVHQACHSLRQRECTVALAGGVHIMLRPDTAVAFSRGRALSPDGRCKAFDAGANGYVRSEGCGMVVLKRLSTAQADGDTILAVIRGSMINQDGRSSGLTVPSGPSQQRVIRQALASAKVDPAQVGYIEAHGTGTSLGDPIEIGAINAVFSGRTEPLWVGSAKTNLGHLEAAAGIAGLLKVILAMQHGEIPRHLHFQQPNPYIDWDGSPVRIPVTPTPWPVLGSNGRRIAGVSSFGFSGTNAHVVVEGGDVQLAAEQGQGAVQPTAHLLPLAAKGEDALRDLALRYADLLQAKPALDLADLCYTAQVGRSHFDYRIGVVATSAPQLQERLAAFHQGEMPAGVVHGRIHPRATDDPIAFLFTGQGAQYVNMGRDLYATQPLFRQIVDQCDELLRPYLPQSLVSVLYPAEEKSEVRRQKAEGRGERTADSGGDAGDGDVGLLDQMMYAQPATFVIEYALAKVWQSWGIQPAVVIGHSLGEFAAACFAGVFSLEDGLKLVAARGRLLQSLPPTGEMVSVIATEGEMQALLAEHPDVSIGAINAPTSVVLSGYRDALQPVIEQLQAQGKKYRSLNIPIAAHSPQTEAILDDFERVARSITLAPPTLPLVSSMTGQVVTREVTDPTYWRRHLRQPVRFAAGMQTVQAHGCSIFMEVGPQATLLSIGAQSLPAEDLHWLPSLHRERSAWEQMLESLAALYVHGVAIDWPRVQATSGAPRRKVVLPTYPFQRQRHWLTPRAKRSPERLRPLLHRMVQSPLHKATIFESTVSVETLPFLADHRVYNRIVAPGACHLAMTLSAAEVAFGRQPCLLQDVLFPAPLVLREDERSVQVVLTPQATNGAGPHAEFQLISFAPADGAPSPLTHASGRVAPHIEPAPAHGSLAELRSRCREKVALDAFYQTSAKQQIEWGPSFRWLTELWQGDGVVLGKLVLPAAVERLTGYSLHPGLLDGCFQAAGVLHAQQEHTEIFLPFAVDSLQLYQPATGSEWWCYVQQVAPHKWDIALLDSGGQVVAEVNGFTVRAAPPTAVGAAEPWREWLYTVEWQRQPRFSFVPDYLLTPDQLHASLRTVELSKEHPSGWESYPMALTQLETLSIDYIVAAFTRAGFTFQVGARWPTEQIARQLEVMPRYHKLLRRLLQILAEEGMLRRDGEYWQVMREPGRRQPQQQAALVQTAYGEVIGAELALLTRCGEKLGEVLRGATDPLPLLFPDGDERLVAALYQSSPGAQAMNGLLQEAMARAIAQLPAGRGVRILEVGAGTGSSTAHLLPHLPPAQTSYCFTDIGQNFLHKAQTRFAAYDFVQYQLLDLEAAPADQHFAAHGFDLIVAANVLHATQDLAQTLAHLRYLLAPGGLLLLWEATTPQRWTDLTFGLTDGWWRFADQRQDHPLRTTPQWQTLLHAAGFPQVVDLVDTTSGGAQVGQALLVAQRDEQSEPQAQPWLILMDKTGIGEALATTLQQRGETVCRVHTGAAFAQLDSHIFRVDPHRGADYHQLLATLPAPHAVVHLWSLDETPITTLDLQPAAYRACDSVLQLAQALLHRGVTSQALWLVTRDAQAVQEHDAVAGFAQSVLWGMGKVIEQEHPELNCICLDLDANAAVTQQAIELCDTLTAGAPGQPAETQIALRAGQRCAARLARTVAAPTPSITCTPEGSYLITGGLNGLGLLMAGWLADQGARHLVLMGRRQPSPAANATLAALRDRGVTVTVAQADVTDGAQVAAVVQAIGTDHPLRGIIHAAGVIDDGALLQQSWERFATVLGPKVWGAWHLQQATAAMALDFFVLFSSTTALLGNRGQANHAAANAFLDAFAHFRQAQGLPGLSINWGAWSEVGRAAALVTQQRAALAEKGIGVIAPAQGVEVFAHLLAASTPAQVGVIPIDWPTYLSAYPTPSVFLANFVTAQPNAPVATAPQPQRLRQQLEALAGAERVAHLTTYLQQVVAQILGMPHLPETDQGFNDLGMDSLTVLELKKQLERGLETTLPSTIGFEYPTVTLLTDYLLTEVLPPTTATVDSTAGETNTAPHPPETNGHQEESAALTDIGQLSADALMAMIAKEFQDQQ